MLGTKYLSTYSRPHTSHVKLGQGLEIIAQAAQTLAVLNDTIWDLLLPQVPR